MAARSSTGGCDTGGAVAGAGSAVGVAIELAGGLLSAGAGSLTLSTGASGRADAAATAGLGGWDTAALGLGVRSVVGGAVGLGTSVLARLAAGSRTARTSGATATGSSPGRPTMMTTPTAPRPAATARSGHRRLMTCRGKGPIDELEKVVAS